MQKAKDGTRITVLCGWCREPIAMRPCMFRQKTSKNMLGSPLFCCQQHAAKYNTWVNDLEKYGSKRAHHV